MSNTNDMRRIRDGIEKCVDILLDTGMIDDDKATELRNRIQWGDISACWEVSRKVQMMALKCAKRIKPKATVEEVV